jgi:hypothetical protein
MKMLSALYIALLFISNANAQNHAALKSFTGKQADCLALLDWTIANEATNKRYEVQCGTDSLNFITSVTVAAEDNIAAERKYSSSLMLAYSSNYFRLKIVSIDENITYSKIIILYNEKCGGSAPIVALVKTNPVIGHSLTMSVVLSKTDNLETKLCDMSGHLISKYDLPATEGKNELNFNLPVKAHGQYILNVYSPINGRVSKKIFVE